MKLFEEFQRTDHDFSSYQESRYDFYNQSARPEFSKTRNLLESWFSAYPDEHKYTLKRDFQDNFYSAFFELFLFTLFLKNNFEVLVHPAINDSAKKPDFLIKKNGTSIYVEARVVFDETNERNIQNIKSRIKDKLNEISSTKFFVGIHEITLFNITRQPSLNKIKDFISKLLVSQELMEKEFANQDLQKFEYQDEAIKFIVSLIPRLKTENKEKPVLIAVDFDEGKVQMVNPTVSLKKALNEKAKKYGKLQNRYIIAVNALSPWITDEEDYLSTLFGSEILVYNERNDDSYVCRDLDGFLRDKSGFRYTRVSGIMFSRVLPENLHNFKLTLYHHPAAAFPIDKDFCQIEQKYVENGELTTKPGISSIALLKIDEYNS